MRSAEASRQSSCAFADRVATLSIEAYKRWCPIELQQSYKQTVLATVLIQIVPPSKRNTVDSYHHSQPQRSRTVTKQQSEYSCCDDHHEEVKEEGLFVVSVGVGTKVARGDTIMVERQSTIGAANGDRIVRDCHAEVLARRGFVRFLYSEVEKCFKRQQQQSKVSDRKQQQEFGEENNNSSSFVLTSQSQSQSSSYCIFDLSACGQHVHLKDCVRVHMYSSSQPCGNASIKRWAKSSRAVSYGQLTASQYPLPEEHPHGRFHVTAMEEGQIAVLVKCNHKNENSINNSENHGCKKVPAFAGEFTCPQGTAHISSGQGNVMTCSDKLARWNTLGLQGALLSHFITKPIYMTTLTLGRKCSIVHAQRAICCRVQDFVSDYSSTGAECSQSTTMTATATTTAAATTAVVEPVAVAVVATTTSTAASVAKTDKITAAAAEEEEEEEDTETMCEINTETTVLNEKDVEKKRRSTGTGLRVSSTDCSPIYCTNHPTIMCTSVKFDEGVVFTAAATTATTALALSPTSKAEKEDFNKSVPAAAVPGISVIGACFEESRCVCCWADLDQYLSIPLMNGEVIEGTTGRLVNNIGGGAGTGAERRAVIATTTAYDVNNVPVPACDSFHLTPSLISSASFSSSYKRLQEIVNANPSVEDSTSSSSFFSKWCGAASSYRTMKGNQNPYLYHYVQARAVLFKTPVPVLKESYHHGIILPPQQQPPSKKKKKSSSGTDSLKGWIQKNL